MIPLGKPSTPIRISLLEEKFQAYDELSKKMLSKLEQAVEKISESNQNISQILIRHEERIDRSVEANDAILTMLSRSESDLKGEMEKQDKKFKEDLDKHEKKINDMNTTLEDLKKNRWIWFGVILASSFFINQLKLAERILPAPAPQSAPLIRYAWPSSTTQI